MFYILFVINCLFIYFDPFYFAYFYIILSKIKLNFIVHTDRLVLLNYSLDGCVLSMINWFNVKNHVNQNKWKKKKRKFIYFVIVDVIFIIFFTSPYSIIVLYEKVTRHCNVNCRPITKSIIHYTNQCYSAIEIKTIFAITICNQINNHKFYEIWFKHR